jgi:hypothetical protein
MTTTVISASVMASGSASVMVAALIQAKTQTLTFTNTFTPTTTATQTPIIKAGGRVFSNSSQLRVGIHTIKAEKVISACVDGHVTSFERWRVVYREPDDCLFEVFDSKDKLERTKFFHGNTLVVTGGSNHQSFETSSPEAWKKVTDFFELKTPASFVRDSRQIFTGAWVPNSSEFPAMGFKSKLGAKSTINHSVTSVTINENVDLEFLSGGR